MSQPTLGQIGNVFARYANLTLGGGNATTAVIHGEIVSKRRWVSEEQFALSFSLGRLTPGTNLLAFCTGIGWMLRSWSGAVVALLAASVPCTLIVVAITVLFSHRRTLTRKPAFVVPWRRRWPSLSGRCGPLSTRTSGGATA
jgi:chromate transporter